jgi:uncharacterized protein (DUF362 family)
MSDCITRRTWIAGAGALAGSAIFTRQMFGAGAPAAPVSVARCRSYGPELVPTLDKMFDQLGGLGRIVKGKTVAIKVNLTGTPTDRLGYLPNGLTHWTHPSVIGATLHLMGRAGARRIRILESPWKSAEPIEEYMLEAGWEPRDFVNAAPLVEFENTNFLGNGKQYVRLATPQGGHMFRAFDLNHSYRDCDVFVSLAKLKEHLTAGVTLSMKNCFGITPCTIYGDGAGENEPGPLPLGGRGPLHSGARQPSKSSPSENDPKSPRDAGYRVPAIVADLVAARPIDLAVIDGIRTQTHRETADVGDSVPVAPGVLVAGTNCVSTDAVGMAVMGFDPLADRGRAPFEHSDSTLRLAEELGVGTRDLARIEVIGTPIAQARFDFRNPVRATDPA